MIWTDELVEKLRWLNELGYANKVIAEELGCSVDQIKYKLSGIRKKDNTYNSDHVEEKYSINTDFFWDINPKSILDPFCGIKRFWKQFESKEVVVVDNDKEQKFSADFHEDAKKLLKTMFKLKVKFDMVDIDPYGDCFSCIDLAIQIAEKGLIITNGFLKNNRFESKKGKNSFFRINYGDSFIPTCEGLENYIIERARAFGKKLTVYAHCPKWKNCDRIWFIVEKMEKGE